MFLRHPLLSVATFAYLGLVGWITLGSQPVHSGNDFIGRALPMLHSYPELRWIRYSSVEFSANILMFIPLGLFFLLLLGRRRWWLAMLFGVALTIAIETAQLFLPDRVSDVRDLVANSAGTVLGVAAALLLTARKARLLPPPR